MELTRNLVDRFNSRYNDVLIKPEIRMPKVGGRVMSLQDPTKKMSKSDDNQKNFISLLDEPNVAAKKLKVLLLIQMVLLSLTVIINQAFLIYFQSILV